MSKQPRKEPVALKPLTAFFLAARAKLLKQAEHRDKEDEPGWRSMHLGALRDRLHDELEELDEALSNMDPTHAEHVPSGGEMKRAVAAVQGEAVDVALFAMMLFDQAEHIRREAEKQETPNEEE